MRFLWKLYLGYVGLILLTTLSVGVLVDRWITNRERDLAERQLAHEVSLLRSLCQNLERGPLREVVTLAGPRQRTDGVDVPVPRLSVLDAEGQVLADSQFPERGSSAPQLAEEEIRLASAATRVVTSRRADTAPGEDTLYAAVAVRDSAGSIKGYARAALPYAQVQAQLAPLRGQVLKGAALAAGAALLLGLYLARRLTKPLVEITGAVKSLAEGSGQIPLKIVRSPDELGTLARAFGDMAGELRERVDTIENERTQLLAILSSMIEGVVAIDREERIVHMNEVAARILNADPRAAAGARIWQATRHTEVSEAFARTLRGGETTRTEMTLPAQPRDQTIELRVSPLRGQDGTIKGAVMVLYDASSLRQLEAHRREFVANVSHELKTPLTAITGFVETLIDEDEMEEAMRQRFLEKIKNQAARLARLVGDVLVLSRVESEEGALDKVLLDLRQAVEDSLRSLGPPGEEKGLAVNSSLPPEPIRVEGDPEALRQVVDNLLSNAIKYTPAGGRVAVRVIEEPGFAVIEVSDTGFGIPPKDQERVFERFYRVDKARSRELGGTGLGLSIVKHVVLAHQGGIAVESQPGEGSLFRVRLPLARTAAPVG